MKILLIEDVRVDRIIIKHWIEGAGHEVIEASNGNEGLSLYHDHQPDLVITDIVMPEKEGIELIMVLMKESSEVKIFAISGAGTKKRGGYLPIAKGVGALRTFVKPIDEVELLDAILELTPGGDLEHN